MILRDLLDEHPELAANELDRLKELFQWWEKKIQLTSKVTQQPAAPRA
jgi:hypothetical protein